ncbi:MAG TPA: hypothetical protein VFV93_02430 [Thermomicrobiales bacterium]|nr:hypothetical protein [Thermomicrobiales bacterium]
MRYLAILAALLALTIVSPVYADEFIWDAADDAGPPKGVVGYDGIQCVGEATQDGHHVKLTNYVGYSAGQPEARERAWQLSECRNMMRDHMRFVFLMQWGVAFRDSTPIAITTRRL